ncbi:hypothetical protein HKX48_001375 [Thoreauomyces humboldtii]|nr:hypothetical protein HKX48_001375 [Thoreauomyces humboldtii]
MSKKRNRGSLPASTSSITVPPTVRTSSPSSPALHLNAASAAKSLDFESDPSPLPRAKFLPHFSAVESQTQDSTSPSALLSTSSPGKGKRALIETNGGDVDDADDAESRNQLARRRKRERKKERKEELRSSEGHAAHGRDEGPDPTYEGHVASPAIGALKMLPVPATSIAESLLTTKALDAESLPSDLYVHVKTPKPNAAASAPQSVSNSKASLLRRKADLQPAREALPIFKARRTLTAEIMNNASVVIVGETGSGKTTQIPQFLNDAGLTGKGMIAITQPRRVAAISIAKRVAEEVGTRLGDKVGYSIRFDDTTSAATRIKYMTDGMLLRELLSDNKLKKYSAIILDEAHERTLRTDILFGMVKAIQKERKDLKIIIMSATLNAEKFSEYFDDAKVLYVAGRQFPVKTFAAEAQQEDYVDAALVATFQLHMEQPKGDILVFLTGQEEIDNLQKLIEETARSLPPTCMKLLVCPIYAKLPTDQQTRVFDPAPPGVRKVILSTNVAETSITISGIRYVIDTGMAKVRSFNAKTGMETLAVQPISKASARQRSGRAGREAPGFCYRLYTNSAYAALIEETEPEIMRCNLASVVLMLKAAGVEDVIGFDYMDKPSRTSIIRALEQLYALGALADDGTISDLGRRMAELPLDPIYAKVLLQSVSYKCTTEILSILSMLSVDVIFFSPNDKREQAGLAKKRFLNHDGDHLTLLNVFTSYRSVNGDPAWCAENFISPRSLRQVTDIRKQLAGFATRMGIDPTVTCGTDDLDQAIKCVLSGCFQNVAMREPDGSYKTVVGHQAVFVHPSSVLFQKKPDAVVYNELMRTTKQYMRNISIIQPAWLVDVAPQYYGRASANTKLNVIVPNSGWPYAARNFENMILVDALSPPEPAFAVSEAPANVISASLIGGMVVQITEAVAKRRKQSDDTAPAAGF